MTTQSNDDASAEPLSRLDEPRTNSAAAISRSPSSACRWDSCSLWAFLDKTFGLHYSTPSSKAWIHGGSPTKGFLTSIDVGRWSRGSIRSPARGGLTGRSCSACSASASRCLLGVLMFAGTAAGVLTAWLHVAGRVSPCPAHQRRGGERVDAPVRRLPLHLRRSPRRSRPHRFRDDVGSGPAVGAASVYSSAPMVALSPAR